MEPTHKKTSISRIVNELLLICGSILALYLLYLKIGPGSCSSDADCSSVIQSKYGSIFGIPISIFALLYWAAIPLLSITHWKEKKTAITLLSWVAALVGIGFLLLQSFFLKGFCPFCAAHTVILLFFALSGAQSTGIWQAVLITLSTIGVIFVSNSKETKIESFTEQTLPLPKRTETQDLTPATLAWALDVTYDWKIPENQNATELAVISLSCPHCRNYLKSLPNNPDIRPHLMISPGTASTDLLTRTFMESVFSPENSPNPRKAFNRTLADFLKNHNRYLNNPYSYRSSLIQKKLLPQSANLKAKRAALDAINSQRRVMGFLGISKLPRRFSLQENTTLWKKSQNEKERHRQARYIANHWFLAIDNNTKSSTVVDTDIDIFDLGNPKCWPPIKTILEDRNNTPLTLFVSKSGPRADQATLALYSYILSHHTIQERQNATYEALALWIENPTQNPSTFKTTLLQKLETNAFEPTVTREAQRLAKDHNYYFYYEGIPYTPVRLTAPPSE